MLDIHMFPCLSDNYGFLVRDPETGFCAAIDTPDAGAYLAAAKAKGWQIHEIWNTHWHHDHIGGNVEIQAATGAKIRAPDENGRIEPCDQRLHAGDELQLGQKTARVIATPGHTLGHIAFYFAQDAVLFVGDTLFALGCGRLFEGDAPTMFKSLQSLAALPDHTQVYCAHEYTQSNLRFALSLNPDDVALRNRGAQIDALRSDNRPTIPTQIGLEKQTNPFLRAANAEDFARIRLAKDHFRG